MLRLQRDRDGRLAKNFVRNGNRDEIFFGIVSHPWRDTTSSLQRRRQSFRSLCLLVREGLRSRTLRAKVLGQNSVLCDAAFPGAMSRGLWRNQDLLAHLCAEQKNSEMSRCFFNDKSAEVLLDTSSVNVVIIIVIAHRSSHRKE